MPTSRAIPAPLQPVPMNRKGQVPYVWMMRAHLHVLDEIVRPPVHVMSGYTDYNKPLIFLYASMLCKTVVRNFLATGNG